MPAFSGFLVFGVLGLAWFVTSATGFVSPFLLPGPFTVAQAGWQLIQDGSLAKHAAISLQRVGLGYGLSVILALPLALLFGLLPRLRSFCEPALEFLRQIPPLALLPLLILWLGIGEVQKVGVIVLSCFFPIFLGALGGIAQADPKLIEVGRICGLSRREILTRIVLPASLPALVVGLRIALGYSWRALVGAELIASSAGLGYLIIDAQNMARTDIVLVGVLVIGVLGLVADALARAALRRSAPWLRSQLELGRV
ncbi:ABC transporter permease [Bosea vaviloviae]|uniref:ABC transporter permease n=1 Tax=Bosea vaviloviae TaxID=1526658 RepID=A0A1D7U6X6_9HYPH|nr:ABC transporter permease [Bosea vaviloviae]